MSDTGYTERYVCIECGGEFRSMGPVTGCSVCGGRNLLGWEEAQRRIQVVEEDMQQRETERRPTMSDKLMFLKSVFQVIEPIRGNNPAILKQITTELKQNYGGEGWAVGEMLERARALLGAIDCYLMVVKEADDE